MKLYDFAPSEELKKALPKAGSLALTNSFINYISEIPKTGISVTGLSDELVDGVEAVSKAYLSTLDAAKKHASDWILNVDSKFQDLLSNMITHASRFDQFLIVVKAEPKREVELLTQNIQTLEGLKTVLDAFQKKLNTDHQAFQKVYESQKTEVGVANEQVTKLENKLRELRAQISDDNDKIASKAGDALTTNIEDGIAALEAAAGENWGEVIAKVFTMTAKSLIFEGEGIVLTADALKLMNEINELKHELSELEVAIFVLNDMGAHMKMMLDTSLQLKALADASADYYKHALDQLQEMEGGKAALAKDTSAAVSAWKTMNGILSAAENAPVKTLPVWNSSETKFVDAAAKSK